MKTLPLIWGLRNLKSEVFQEGLLSEKEEGQIYLAQGHFRVLFLMVEDNFLLPMWSQNGTWPFTVFSTCRVGSRLSGPSGALTVPGIRCAPRHKGPKAVLVFSLRPELMSRYGSIHWECFFFSAENFLEKLRLRRWGEFLEVIQLLKRQSHNSNPGL